MLGVVCSLANYDAVIWRVATKPKLGLSFILSFGFSKLNLSRFCLNDTKQHLKTAVYLKQNEQNETVKLKRNKAGGKFNSVCIYYDVVFFFFFFFFLLSY